MNKLEVFKFEEDKEIRTQVDANGNPLFCVKDICDMLNIGNVGSATKDLETTLHKQYAEYRVTYEWFKLTKELIDSIINDNNFTIL